MAFALKRKESIPKGWVRLSKNCASKALRLCEKKDLDSIHSARRQIKRLRALLRLIKCDINPSAHEKVNGNLRKAAKRLAAPRDAHVQSQTLRKLTLTHNGSAAQPTFIRFQELLKRRCRKELSTFRTRKRSKPVEQLLRAVPDQFEELSFKSKGWNAIGPGLKKSYARARAARMTAHGKPSAQHLHAWRKGVKDLTLHLRLLKNAAPKKMGALLIKLERLGELLGDEHDLSMLRRTVVRESINQALESEAGAILPLIELQRLRLRNTAFSESSPLFEEKPSDFYKRLHRDWNDWRKQKNKASRRAASSTSSRERDSLPDAAGPSRRLSNSEARA
ncbi:MAG: CHAD domain-containing protein [Limisphaerales bacterium]